ncbi:MAG: hypothetical protein ACK4UN_13195 [Limisphaerales bacterium]
MLTTLASLKKRLGIEPFDLKDDAALTLVIKALAGRFEKETNRIFGRTVNAAEQFSADQMEIIARLYPIEEVTSFHLKTSEREGWVLQQNYDFLIRHDCIISLVAPLGSQRQLAKVTYTGGYVLPGTVAQPGQTPLPADLEQATIEQAAYWYQNKDRLGIVSLSGEGGSIQQFSQLDLLPNVKAVLKKHERYVC